MNTLVLKHGREKSLKRRHPWIFSGALEKVEGSPESGETILVRSHDGKPLALAAWSPQSQIRARVWSFDTAASIDRAFFEERIRKAVALRAASRRHRREQVHADESHLAARRAQPRVERRGPAERERLRGRELEARE